MNGKFNMQISKEQMDVFSKGELLKFEERIADFLQEEFSDAQEVPKEELMPAIHQQVNDARSYDLETEQQIVNYVTTAWLLGEEFDTEFPAARKILMSSEHSADDKAQWLAQWTKKIFTILEEEGN